MTHICHHENFDNFVDKEINVEHKVFDLYNFKLQELKHGKTGFSIALLSFE